ncbi:GNAT family N-acetyltransferase [Saccharibacillus deserti]|uniref:GNAT family N-acetyltransferase n=1 Tax=Saccharibacillus deserti TaxID=1634444 RepID=UPI003CCE2BB5
MKEGLGDEFHIAALAAMPQSRGLGTGSKMIAFAEEEALRQRFTACSLTVSLGNPDAKRLYERLGYRVTEELPGMSLQRMRKALI